MRVIVPADPKSFPAKAAVRAFFPALQEAGVDIREHPSMAHAKVVLADDTVFAGTANLDGLSLRRNWSSSSGSPTARWPITSRRSCSIEISLSPRRRGSRPAAANGP